MGRRSADKTPHNRNDSFTITELIPLEKLQLIQDSFAEANQVASTLTAIDGTPITRLSNHSGVCSMVRATEKGLFNCIKSGHILGEQALDAKEPIHRECLSIGFTDAAAPIIVNDKHIANWLIGQYHVGKVDERRVREYADEIGADPHQMVEEYNRMPKHSLEDFEKKLNLLGIMANELSNMAYQRLQQQQQTEELKRIRIKLEEYQTQLEHKVRERTKELSTVNKQLLDEIKQRAKIQQRQSRLITAIESAVESIIITSRSARIIYVNPAFENLTGYSTDEVIGKKPDILKSEYHDDAFCKELWEKLIGGEVWSGRLTNKRKDGTIYQEDTTISPVKNEQGKIISFVAVQKDVTREITLEKQLVHAQRLESIGILAAGVAHDINTPIQYVLTNTRFFQEVLNDLIEMQRAYRGLAEAVSGSALYQEQLDTIKKLQDEIEMEELLTEANEAMEQVLTGIESIAGTVSALKDFAKPAPDTMQPANLNNIIESVVDVSSSVWQKNGDVELRLAPDLPMIALLSDKIKQVVLDMLVNSSHSLEQKYGNSPDQKGKIRISTLLNGQSVELHIEDTGEGIPPKVIDKIFDPFFTTKPVGQGSGQGLARAHGVIVDQHGGSIRASSVPGEGTIFIITLPAGSED